MTFKDALASFRATGQPDKVDLFIRHLMALCANCAGLREEHVDRKCLFNAGTYRSNAPAARRYEAWLSKQRLDPARPYRNGFDDPFWDEQI